MAWLPLVDAQSTLPSQTQTRPVVKTSSLDGDVDVQSKKRLDEIEAQYRKRLDDEKPAPEIFSDSWLCKKGRILNSRMS